MNTFRTITLSAYFISSALLCSGQISSNEYKHFSVEIRNDGSSDHIEGIINGLRTTLCLNDQSDTTIVSCKMVDYMVKNGHLTTEDVYSDSISGKEQLNLRIVKIGETALNNLPAIISDTQKEMVDLSINAIKRKIDSLHIDDQRFTILRSEVNFSSSMTAQIRKDADTLFRKENYTQALKEYQKLYQAGNLDPIGVVRLSDCHYILKDFKNALSYLKEVEPLLPKDTLNMRQYNYAVCYYDLGNYDKAIPYLVRSIEKNNNELILLGSYYILALTQARMKRCSDAIRSLKKTIELAAERQGLRYDDVIAERCNNFDVQCYVFGAASVIYESCKTNTVLRYIRISARSGYKTAQNYCLQRKIKY